MIATIMINTIIPIIIDPSESINPILLPLFLFTHIDLVQVNLSEHDG
jgi:hypothetical protein